MAKSVTLQSHDERMLHYVMVCAICHGTTAKNYEDWTSLTFSLTHCYCRYETSCTKDVTLCNASTFVSALPQSLRKVELCSTSCNACSNKMLRDLVIAGRYTMQILVQFVSLQNSETSCTTSCPLERRLNSYLMFPLACRPNLGDILQLTYTALLFTLIWVVLTWRDRHDTTPWEL